MSTKKQSNFIRKVALRYLWARQGEAFISIITVISILGVAVGVMVINMVMAVMTGFEEELRDKILSANSHIIVRHLGGQMQNYEETKQKVSNLSGVNSVSAFALNQALLRTKNRATGLLIRGIERDGLSAKQLSGYLTQSDDIKKLFDRQADQTQVELPTLIIGKELQRSMGVFVGDTVSLLSAGVSSTPFGLVPKYKRFVVVAVYSSGLTEYESGLAYTNLTDAQNFFQMPDAVSGLETKINDIDAAPTLAKEILEKLGGVASGFYVEDWTQTHKPLWDAIRLEKKVYFLVLLLIVLMASFSIVSTLIMIVLEKRRDIAVLRSMGASTKSVAGIFRMQGSIIGGLGTLLGLIAGYLGCVALRHYGFPLDEQIFQMSTLPIRIELINFVVVGISSFAICFLATIYPARRASQLNPAELLRAE